MCGLYMTRAWLNKCANTQEIMHDTGYSPWMKLSPMRLSFAWQWPYGKYGKLRGKWSTMTSIKAQYLHIILCNLSWLIFRLLASRLCRQHMLLPRPAHWIESPENLNKMNVDIVVGRGLGPKTTVSRDRDGNFLGASCWNLVYFGQPNNYFRNS